MRERRRRKKKARKQRQKEAKVHKIEEPKKEPEDEPEEVLRLVDKPPCNYIKAYDINAEKYKDPVILFDDKKSVLIEQINKDIREYNGVKFSIGLSLQFFKDEKDGTRKYFTGAKHGDQSAALVSSNLKEFYDEQVEHLKRWIENFTSDEGTKAAVANCIRLYLNIAKYEPLKGSSYIPLPKALADKKAIINVKNKDNKWLFHAINSALNLASDHSDRLSNYPDYSSYLKTDGVDFPTPISQISRVEKQNNLAINVYGATVSPKLKKINVFPYRISEQPKERHRINLLFLSEDDEAAENPAKKTTKYHYCWIKNLNRLLYDQNRHKCKTYFCDRCLYGFTKEDLLIQHKEDCEGINKNSTRIEMPTEGNNYITFKNHQNQMPVPYVIYADFGSIIKPKTENAGDKSEITSEHEACGFGYQVVRFDGKAEEPVIYRGKDAVEIFINNLECQVSNINNIFAHPKPITMTEQETKDHAKATHCWICEKELGSFKTNPKVRDHCHFTGRYRGPAHKSCNLKLKIKPGVTKIPVIFHNLKGYDSHLIMQKLHTANGNISCIANNAEKYISFSVGQIKFLDSFQFMASSLEKLVDATGKSDFRLTQKEFRDQTELILRKGVYPYEYFDSMERFNETQLPPIDKFYSKLSDESISQKDYEHAQTVWQEFNCKTLGDYHNLYLKNRRLVARRRISDLQKNMHGLI